MERRAALQCTHAVLCSCLALNCTELDFSVDDSIKRQKLNSAVCLYKVLIY